MRRRRFRGGGHRAPTQWVVGQPTWATGTAVGAAGKVGIMLCGATGVTASYDPPLIQRYTVVRVRGDILIYSAPVTGHGNRLALGIIVVTTQTGGGTTLPSPGSVPGDGGAPWLWLWHGAQLVTTSLLTISDYANRIPVDIRVSRRLDHDEQLQLVVENLGEDSVLVTPFLRSLIKRVA